jgi:hypothetical protein
MGYRQMYGDVNTVSVLCSLASIFQKLVLDALFGLSLSLDYSAQNSQSILRTGPSKPSNTARILYTG